MGKIRSKVAFQYSSDNRVLATLQVLSGLDCGRAGEFTLTTFDDENELLQQIVLAHLSDEKTVELLAKVLVTSAGRPDADPWVFVCATPAQFSIFGLRLPASASATHSTDLSGFLRSLDLKAALEQTPIPLCLLEGPQHTITFINEGYVQLIGRQHRSQILGKPVRAALQDMEGQPFFAWLDQTYRTGEPYIGHEVPGRLFSYRTEQVEDYFFDFVYYPVWDAKGEVCGILCQATDVTERVLDRQVRDAREEQLYRQWAELDTLYRTSPLSMALIRASDLVIQRINEHNAALLGGEAEDLIGHCIEEFYPEQPFVGEVLRKVIADRTARTLEITSEAPSAPGSLLRWHWNLNPILDATGKVESIASTVLEITQPTGDLEVFLDITQATGDVEVFVDVENELFGR